MNEMELLVRAGMIFSEAICQACNPIKALLTEYNQSVSNHVACMNAAIIADNYFDKTWQERTKYYDLKIDKLVGNLGDEQAISSRSTEPESSVM